MARKFRELLDAMPPKDRAEVSRRTEATMASMPLQELRQARHLSQQTLAEALGASQAAISKLERRADMYVSTLRRYVNALGGELEITARFPEGSVTIDQFHALDEAAGVGEPH